MCQNLTSEDVAKTFKTNKQMDKNAAKLEGEGGTRIKMRLISNKDFTHHPNKMVKHAGRGRYYYVNQTQTIQVNHLIPS